MPHLRPYLLYLLLSITLIGCVPMRLQRAVKISEGDWLLFGGNPERTNQSLAIVTPPLELAWEYDAAAGFGSGSPVAADSFVFVGTLQGEIHAIHAKTGDRKGVFSVESAVTGSPLIDGISIIAGSAKGDRTLVSYDFREGTLRWSRELGGIESSPLRFANKLFVTTLTGVLYCLEKSDGSDIWRFETHQPIRSSPATDGRVVVFGCDDGHLYAVDIETGKAAWKFKARRSIFCTPAIYRGAVLFGSMDSTFYALSVRDGTLLWKQSVGGKIYAGPSFYEDLAFFGATDGTLTALHVSDGSEVWKFKASSIINSSPVVSDRIVYVGSLDKHIYGLDVLTGEVKWKHELQGRVKTTPIVWRDYLIVAAEDRSILAFRPKTGQQ